MARSRRLRKKLRVDEFQELAFNVTFTFNEGTSEADKDRFFDAFLGEFLESMQLGFDGEGDDTYYGIIATQTLGKCTDEQRDQVKSYLESKGLLQAKVSELYDLWWGV